MLLHVCLLAGRRSLLLHLPRQGDGRFMLSSSAPLDPCAPFEGFTELPPGMYSLQLEQPCNGVCSSSAGGSSGRSRMAAGTAAMDGTAAVDSSSGVGSSVAGSHGLGTQPASYQRVEWAEANVRQLAAFSRAPELVEPPGDEAAEEIDADFQATADAVLAALRQAVATRCRCIDERQPQPQDAAAAAAAHTLDQPVDVSDQLHQLDSLTLRSSSSSSSSGNCTDGSSAAARPAAPLLPPAPVLILFSGGVDSTLLAALAHEALPPGVPIDLASVCFDNGGSPDRQSALDALEELRAFAPGRQWRLVQVMRIAWARGRRCLDVARACMHQLEPGGCVLQGTPRCSCTQQGGPWFSDGRHLL